MNKKEKIIPVVGMGVTMSAGSDSYPYTVVNVISENKVEITADDFKRVDDNPTFSESQKYEYESRMDAHRTLITRRKNGRWFPVGEKMANYGGFRVGFRRAHWDPHF
jgi:hypothetical protein